MSTTSQFGLVTDTAILATGVEVMLMGWSLAFYDLLYCIVLYLIGASSQDKRHAIVTNIALLFGWLSVAVYLR